MGEPNLPKWTSPQCCELSPEFINLFFSFIANFYYHLKIDYLRLLIISRSNVQKQMNNTVYHIGHTPVKIPAKICGINTGDFQMNVDGAVKLKILVKNEFCYPNSDGEWHIRHIKLEDLHGFIGGLILTSVGYDGTCDDDVKIQITLTGSDASLPGDNIWLRCDPYVHDLLDEYMLWTDDGVYNDDDLERLQSQVSGNPTTVKKMLHDANHPRMALDLNGVITLFACDVPLSFLSGIRMFQRITKFCATYLIDPL